MKDERLGGAARGKLLAVVEEPGGSSEQFGMCLNLKVAV
jgi:hypothetical protein